jgi:MFS family permease
MQPSPPARLDARRQQRVTFAVLAVSVSAFALLQSLIVPVLPTIQAQYATDQATVTWVLTGYLLSASIATPILGRVGDAIGKKKVLVATLAVLALGSLLAALAPSVGWLIAARVVQGLGGGVLPLSFGIIRDEFDDRVTGALSVIASLTAVGFGFGIVVAGPIVDVLGYHWLFWLPMIITAVAAVAAAALVPESPERTPGGVPLLPALPLAVTLVALLLAISQGGTWGWGSPAVLGLLATSVVVGAVWVRVETTVAVPMIDMRMMRLRGVWTTNVVAFFVGFGTFASFAFLPQLLQTPASAGYGFGATISESGHLLVPSAIASFVMGFTTARLIGWVGARSVIVTGTLINAAAFAAVALFHGEKWQLFAATTAQGIGSGLVFSSLAGVVIASVPRQQTGVASGMNANIRTIGGSMGSAVMAGVLTASLGPAGFPLERGYTIGFGLLALGMLAAAGAAAYLPDVRRTPGRPAPADAGLDHVPAAPAAP